jgi:hypothetical protein
MNSSFVVRHSSFVKSTSRTAKIFSIILITLYSLLSTLYSAHAATTSSKELIDDAKTFDGRTVTYKGEAVTAILKRGEYSWVNLNDGENAIGVWCKSSLLDQLKYAGDYKHKGDTIEVEGTFHRACPQHKGELDIHAEKAKILKQGFGIKEDIDKRKMHAAVAILLITLFAIIFFRRKAY